MAVRRANHYTKQVVILSLAVQELWENRKEEVPSPLFMQFLHPGAANLQSSFFFFLFFLTGYL